jgi:hypothetical protein
VLFVVGSCYLSPAVPSGQACGGSSRIDNIGEKSCQRFVPLLEGKPE